jgi:hypothetical protein
MEDGIMKKIKILIEVIPNNEGINNNNYIENKDEQINQNIIKEDKELVNS